MHIGAKQPIAGAAFRPGLGSRASGSLLSLLTTLVLATALAFAVELIARDSLSSTLAFFADIHRPGWTTVLLFALTALAIDALLGRAQGGLIILAPLVLIPAWISSQKGMYLSDPFYPTDFLYAPPDRRTAAAAGQRPPGHGGRHRRCGRRRDRAVRHWPS